MPALPRTLGRLLPQRLGRQLMLMTAATLWLTIGLFGAYTFREQSAAAIAGIEQQAVTLARDLALLNEPLLVSDRFDEIEALSKTSMETPQVLEIRIVDSDGASISRVVRRPGEAQQAVYDAPGTRLAPPPMVRPTLAVDLAKQHVVAWHPVQSGTLLGWVRVEHGTQALAEIRSRLWQSTLVACLLAGFGSVALLSALLRKPLRALDAAKAFAVDLQRIEGQQLETIEGPLETRALGRALNLASTQLFDQRRTIDANIAALRQQEAALADTNEQLRTIFALSPDALVSFDAGGRVSFANAAFFRLTGLTPEALIGQHDSVLDQHLRSRVLDPAGYTPLFRLFDSADAAPTQLVLERPRATVLELVGRHGHAPSVSRLLYARDITRESEIDRMKSEFLSTAAHELRTPMTGIHACVELMLSRELPPPRQQHLLGIVNRQSRAMMAIVDELLDLARIESGHGADFNYDNAELGALVARAVDDFVAPADRSAPELRASNAPGVVRVDAGKFAQVVRNLLSNAYKYSNGGAVEVRLLAPRDGKVGLQVEDHGIGMTPEQLARVTERFYRADASGHVLGTGLGMSIVDDIVRIMGGTLELASQIGQGTTVTVWLPLAEPATADADVMEPAEAA